jgi:hypothetical protein
MIYICGLNIKLISTQFFLHLIEVLMFIYLGHIHPKRPFQSILGIDVGSILANSRSK